MQGMSGPAHWLRYRSDYSSSALAPTFYSHRLPDANRLLPLVVKALPGAAPLIVEQPAADFLRESGGSVLSARNANKLAVFALIRAAVRFGPEQARARLISALQPAAEDDRNALRRLCAGAVEAGSKDADLSILDDGHSGIERIVTHLVTKSATGFLVPLGIANELTPRLRSWLGDSDTRHSRNPDVAE